MRSVARIDRVETSPKATVTRSALADNSDQWDLGRESVHSGERKRGYLLPTPSKYYLGPVAVRFVALYSRVAQSRYPK